MRLAEDRFLQDLVDAQYGSDGDSEDHLSGDEAGKRMKDERRDKARRKALAKSRAAGNQHIAGDGLEALSGESRFRLTVWAIRSLMSYRRNKQDGLSITRSG